MLCKKKENKVSIIIYSVDLLCVEYSFHITTNIPGRAYGASPLQHDAERFHILTAHGLTASGIIEWLEWIRIDTNWDE